MPATTIAKNAETIFLTLADLPQFKRKSEDIVDEIMDYFRNVLSQHQTGRSTPYLLLPSALNLSGYFECSELDILEALTELREDVYDFEIRGLDGPICLRDPLGRTQKNLNILQNLTFILSKPLHLDNFQHKLSSISHFIKRSL